jgi:hypothetical protein
MARYFQITTPEGMSNPKLDSQGCATLQLKAKNVTGAPLDGRAILVSLPVTTPPSGAVQSGWVKIDGPPDQHFEKDQEKVFVVKIVVPKKDKPKPGNYQFRLDVVSVAVTDQGDSSQVIAFTVDEIKNGTKPFQIWVIPVILVVLIGIGVGLWLALRGDKVPDLTGMAVADATTALQGVDMTLDAKTLPGKPEDSGKIISQDPAKGEKATKGGKVEVTVGAGTPVGHQGPVGGPVPVVTPVVTNETYKTPEKPSGRCAAYSGWYSICSDPKPSGWKIVSNNFQLYGDRSCTSGWAQCETTVNTPAKVCYQFRMQGHSEQCTHPGNTGIQNSRGELSVSWQHP